MLEEVTGLLQGLRSVGMQRKLPFGGYFAVFFSQMLSWSRDDVGSEGISEHEGNDSIDLAARR